MPARNTGMKIHSEEFKQKIKEKLNPPGRSYSTTKGRKLVLSEAQREDLRNRAKGNNERGFENKGGRCQFFEVDGIRMQGRYELRYYLECADKPTKPNRIKTPYGWYAPDFEFHDRFVEIKSSYTIKTCVSNKQSKKIVWVRNNVKPVEIKVLNEGETKLFLLQYDISEFTYQPSKN